MSPPPTYVEARCTGTLRGWSGVWAGRPATTATVSGRSSAGCVMGSVMADPSGEWRHGTSVRPVRIRGTTKGAERVLRALSGRAGRSAHGRRSDRVLDRPGEGVLG